MGIFTNNTLSTVGGVDYTQLPALEGYDATTGFAVAMLETQQNDMALFNAIVMEDYKELKAVQEGYEVINESAADVLNKIKEFFVKLLQKIKGIFKAFLGKLSQVFGSNRGVYDKYKKQIASYTNWKDFKVKDFRKVKGDKSGLDAITSAAGYEINNMTYNIGYNASGKNGGGYICTDGKIKYSDMIGNEALDTDDIYEDLIKGRLKSSELKSELDTDIKNMNKAFMDTVFDDAETADEWKASDITGTNIGLVLYDADKIKKTVNDLAKNLESNINKIINKIDTEQGKIAKELVKKDGKYNSAHIAATAKTGTKNKADIATTSNYSFDTEAPSSTTIMNYGGTGKGSLETLNKMISNVNKIATQEQTLIQSLNAASLSAMKFLISQARKVWASAAAYSSREHKNEGYEFYTAIGEASAYDFMSDMEAINA